MLLRNYYIYIAMMFNWKASADAEFGEGYLSLKNVSGALTYPVFASAVQLKTNPYCFQYFLRTLGYYTYGTGTTPPTYEDYALESTITTGLQYTTANTLPVYDAQTKKWTCTVSHTLINSISYPDVTIGELGLWIDAYSGRVLISRTVFDTPITVLSGGTVIITYTLEYQMP